MGKYEFEFPEDDGDDALEVEPSSVKELDAQDAPAVEEDEADIEVVDDTPEEDRGRLPSEPPEDVTEEELEAYSDKVRKRIKHFSKGYHDERRAKEAALREREELEALARSLVEENKQLKGRVNKSQTALLDQARVAVDAELAAAKRAYKEAYESGDSEALLKAHEDLTSVRLKEEKLNNFKPQPLQEDADDVTIKRDNVATKAPSIDEKAIAWKDKNPWFGVDQAMTGFALGLHQELVNEGVDPRSDAYYATVNRRMREAFPRKFASENTDESDRNAKPQRKPNVVAPSTRAVNPRKITLTKTQVSIAKRLGVPLEEYAKQVALEMRKSRNG